MTTLPSGLPVVVQRADSVPLAVQISAQLEAAVTGGVLHAGDRLPSSRDLAVSLGVSRTVVTNAYARLFAEGWLEGRHGSGTYVADVAAPPAVPRDSPRRAAPAPGAKPPAAAPAAPAGADEPVGRPAPIDLQPGISWADGIEPAAWRRAWRQAGAHLPSRWPDPYGLPELREAIAAYLRRSRGLAVGPEQVLDHPGGVERAGAAGGCAPGAGRPGRHRGTGLPYRSRGAAPGRGASRPVPGRRARHRPRGAARRSQAALHHARPSVPARRAASGQPQAGADHVGEGDRRDHRRGRLRQRVPLRRRPAAGPAQHGPGRHRLPRHRIEDPRHRLRRGLAGRAARAGRQAGGDAPATRRPHPRAGPARDPRPAPLGRPGAPYPPDAPGVRPPPRRPGRRPDPRRRPRGPGHGRSRTEPGAVPAARRHVRHARGAGTSRRLPGRPPDRRGRRARRQGLPPRPLLRGQAHDERPDHRLRHGHPPADPPRRVRACDAAQPLSAPKPVSRAPGAWQTPGGAGRSRPTLIVPRSRHTALIQSGASARDHEGFYHGEG